MALPRSTSSPPCMTSVFLLLFCTIFIPSCPLCSAPQIQCHRRAVTVAKRLCLPRVCWLELAGTIHVHSGQPQTLLTETTSGQHLTTHIQCQEIHRLLEKLQRALSQNPGRIRSQNHIICLIPLNTYEYKKLVLN